VRPFIDPSIPFSRLSPSAPFSSSSLRLWTLSQRLAGISVSVARVLATGLLDAWYLAAAGTLGLVLSEVFGSVPWIPPPTTVLFIVSVLLLVQVQNLRNTSAKGSATPEAGRVAHILREQSSSRALARACRRSFGSWISRILWADEMAEGADSFPHFNQLEQTPLPSALVDYLHSIEKLSMDTVTLPLALIVKWKFWWTRRLLPFD
jgi:hypothetical protein